MRDSAGDETKLSILHDHYKDTFSHIRDRERQRDRLFYVVVGVITLLFIEVLYPENTSKILDGAKLPGVEVDMTALPMAVIVSATWTVLVAVALRYYQSMVHIDRQYDYLHKLEERLATEFSVSESDQTFRREGHHYLTTRALFSDWVGVFYTWGFPAIVFVGTLGVFVYEALLPPAPWYHLIYDGLAGLAVWTSIVLYRVAVWRDQKRETNQKDAANGASSDR